MTDEARCDTLGLSAGDQESKYKLHVLTELKNRDATDVPMVIRDGLTEPPNAITTT